ncbi:MAG: BMP family ABC transporter substrate-binding protein [Firmicutes bacterium]|nr:BMP family ABC transporter substrate-binding protein [Bacillota bacterium]
MNEKYLKARKAGEKEYKVRLARGEYPYLAALDDILPENGTLQQQSLGLMEIPVEMIAGTKTLARQNSFAPNFMPLLDINTEFSYKWSNLVEAQIKEGFNDPIRVYEYLHRFYVLEGNKRVSVSRFLDMPTIMADVTRIIPTADVLQTEPAYAEFLEFFKAVPVYDMECTRPGAYKEIAEIAGISLDKPWPMDKVRHLQAVYWSFAKVTSELSEKLPEMTMGDAFVVYLRIFRGDAMYDDSEKEVGQRLRQITKELYTQNNNDKVSLVESSDEVLNAGNLINKAEKIIAGPGSLVSKVLPGISYSVNNPLKAAFIYNRCPEHSNWIYNHEAGRLRLEESFGGMVKTARFIADGKNIEGSPESAGSFEEAVAAAVSWGADVVFTTSVQQIDDALRAAIRYKDVKFLNCSINLTHQAVRTYYAKLYEAKFLAGIVAGAAAASDGSHRIGYCSDYPIYGTIAGINAFAICAAMADPVVQIDLEWSAKQDSNWWWSMVDKGIHVISAIDSTHNTDGSNAYGVCYVERVAPGEGTDLSGTCRITNLAAPIWKWGKLYEIIVKTIIDGTYNARLVDKKDQATNYWWGMISGVVDIELSDEISPYTKQLVDILKSDIICGAMNPFDGDLRSQTGIVRKADDEPLSSMDIITMDWLNENICGEIPVAEALTDEGKATVSVSGIK